MVKPTSNPLLKWVAEATLCLLPTLLNAQPSLQISSPTNGANIQVGQTLTVTVAASGTFEMVVLAATSPLLTIQPEALTAPPYQFSVTVPSNIPLRSYYLTATGLIGPGQGTNSPQVAINIVGNGVPTLSSQPSFLNFRFVGDQLPLQISAQFSSGSPVDATLSSSTTYMSNSTDVATVNSQGIVTATGVGSTSILVSGTLLVPVTVPPPIVIAPPVVSLYPGDTEQFVAQLHIAAITGTVNWSATPPGVGTISSTGRYTAPSAISAQQVVTVTATNAADNTQSGSASVMLYPFASAQVSPATATLGPSQTQQFQATVQNAANSNMAVSWSISPSGAGTVDGTGLYTAPASITSTQTVTLTATSVAYPYATKSATITLTPQ